jgi:hypothetical protein
VRSLLDRSRNRHDAGSSQEDVRTELGTQGKGFVVDLQRAVRLGADDEGAEDIDYDCDGLPSLQTSQPRTGSEAVSTTGACPATARVFKTPHSGNTSDVVDRGIISMNRASDLVKVYKKDLVQHFPGVVIRPDWSASNLRQTKPVLFLAVITAASLGEDFSLSGDLNQELARVFADRIFIKGEKSLELIQSLLITVTYHNPAESPWKALLSQYTHAAATMALEIGIVSKSQVEEHSANDVVENCRTLLTCYLLSAG